jgi:hypothetical protein
MRRIDGFGPVAADSAHVAKRRPPHVKVDNLVADILDSDWDSDVTVVIDNVKTKGALLIASNDPCPFRLSGAAASHSVLHN